MKKINILSVYEFDDLVEKTYKRIYSFQQQNGCKSRGVEYFTIPIKEPKDYKNDSIPEIINGKEIGVSFKAWLERDPDFWPNKEDPHYYLDFFWKRSFYPHVEVILNDLHSKGLLEEGEYAIDIDW